MVIAGNSARAAHAWDFRLIRSYYQQHGRAARDTNSQRVLNCELIAYLIELLEFALSNENSSSHLLTIFHDSQREDRIQKLDTDDMDLS